ncbi:MAG: type II toxin-antitoxin system RelE/ParE family toxin [Bacillota bacterium]|nr:type II toxin-antitoxin system RelE/ParE family toxin [Bacillota bacterium]NLL26121.1 plasmid maintenance system killer protein [Erysipelotrichia bacterium]
MEIEYKNNKIRKICTDASFVQKKHGLPMAEIIHQRIDEITAAESVEEMIKYRIGNCHRLKGNRKNQYAVDLIQPFRLVFKRKEYNIQIAYIIEIIDYH